ncbi:Nuclear receptor corepressor [Heracleum sosnowskyi]|uniref:Nuclear receptor corepressor n=1 Tax=Heracleum sosnowskyi TaxID=360622 RepID=A0AAD8MZW2_9APIA|nr:Nuclear receptor corepressor [Heracleum sosnowskyi]
MQSTESSPLDFALSSCSQLLALIASLVIMMKRNHLYTLLLTRCITCYMVPTSEVINFANKLLGNSHMKFYRSALKMPSLILDNKEKIASRFISNNGLVEDPSTAEKERCMVNPWTLKEKEVFLDRLTTFGKDYRKIASFLDHKTTADCVEFYYKNHKSDCFQRTKKRTEFPKHGKSCLASTFLVTSGKRQASISNAASFDMLGAASVIAAHVENKLNDWQKCPSKVFGTCNPKTLGDDGICKKSSNPDVLGNESESIAGDVLAGICGSLSSEAMSSCITSSVDFGEGYQERKSLPSSVRRPLTPDGIHNVVSETFSDQSCGEINPTNWTDEEKSSFIQAVTSYGKDFTMISQSVKTRSSDQCKAFFSKARKCLGLDKVMHSNQCIPANDDAKGGVCGDNVNACVVETICNEKSRSKIAEE